MYALLIVLVIVAVAAYAVVWRWRNACVGQYDLALLIPPCPKGTVACPGKQKGYCYDPATKAMVSTYHVPQYDACPAAGKSNGNAPIPVPNPGLFGTDKVWLRQVGWDAAYCGAQPAA